MTLDYFLKYLIEKTTLCPGNITIHWMGPGLAITASQLCLLFPLMLGPLKTWEVGM